MYRCQHDHSAPEDAIHSLPHNQAGPGRHKCAICAYQKGYSDAVKRMKSIIEGQNTDLIGQLESLLNKF